MLTTRFSKKINSRKEGIPFLETLFNSYIFGVFAGWYYFLRCLRQYAMRTHQRQHQPSLFNSSTAWFAARAVSAMKVSDGFWVEKEVMQAPSVT